MKVAYALYMFSLVLKEIGKICIAFKIYIFDPKIDSCTYSIQTKAHMANVYICNLYVLYNYQYCNSFDTIFILSVTSPNACRLYEIKYD